MRLKRIELAGFKSFVDPTRIELGEGITAIVGPNGCGKSNIVDAIRWVLGEHSARNLRGGVMDDLIFQGSQNRPPVGMCDVELTFAVEKNQLPPPYHELTEISVRRRLTREVGSDAFINGKPVRIKDIVDLFLDTGVSGHAYAIVEQGQIDRLITAKPEERRLILEEAAGVMKYRARRREAERKMADTEQNLERVMDLLEEVRSQCRSLRQQASRAERFKQMQDELGKLRQISLAIRYRRRQAACRQEEQEVANIRSRELEAAQAQAAAERAVAEARQALIDHEQAAAKAQDHLRKQEQRRAELQRQAERLAGERRLLGERKAMLAQRLQEGRRRLAELQAEEAELKTRLTAQDDAELKARIAQAAAAVAAAKKAHGEQQHRRDTLLADYERLKAEHSSLNQRRERASQMIARIEKRLRQLQMQRPELEASLNRLQQELAQSEAAAKADEQRQKRAIADLKEAEEQLAQARQRQTALRSQLTQAEEQLRRIRGIVQELRSRLQRESVPQVLQQAVEKYGGTWVDESLAVPPGLELAVAAALRGEAGDARLPADWQQLRQVMAATEGSAVAFYTGDNDDPTTNSMAEALGLGRKHPLYAMFADIALAARIDQARDILAQDGRCMAVVSRDGWRLERNGWLIAPAHAAMARRLERQRELKTQEKALAAAERQHAELSARLQAAEAELDERQAQWQRLHVGATEAASSLAASKAAAKRLAAEAEATTARLQRLENECAELREELAHWRDFLATSDKGDDAALKAAAERLAEQTAALNREAEALAEARRALAAAEQELALHRQAAAATQRDLQRLQDEGIQLAAQIRADEQRLQEIEAQLQRTEAQAKLDAALARAHAAVEDAHAALNKLRQEGHAMQQRLREAERREREARQQHARLLEKRQQAELKLASEHAHLQDLEAEIEQRFHQPAAALLNRLEALPEPPDEEQILARLQQLEERLNRFGPVNLLAIEEFAQASEREQFLASQAADLEASLHTLADTIKRIDRRTRQRFNEAFERTNAIFRETFPRMFGGGRAELRLNGDDPLTAGVDIIAQPPGKKLQDIGLLSGGEKALTAIALVFSIFRMKPAPFCILDEVDAPLDETNVGRFGQMVRELAKDVQFLTVTHNKVTMQAADRIIGISMPEPGVSRIVGVELERMAA